MWDRRDRDSIQSVQFREPEEVQRSLRIQTQRPHALAGLEELWASVVALVRDSVTQADRIATQDTELQRLQLELAGVRLSLAASEKTTASGRNVIAAQDAEIKQLQEDKAALQVALDAEFESSDSSVLVVDAEDSMLNVKALQEALADSERDKLHRAIAANTERVGADDTAQFLDIAQHFSHFDGAVLGTLVKALPYASRKMEIELLSALLNAVLALAGQESHLVGLRTKPALKADPALQKREAQAEGVSCWCGVSLFRIFYNKVRPAPEPSSVSVTRSVTSAASVVVSVCSAGALGRVMLIAYSMQSELRRTAAVLASQAQDPVDYEREEEEQVGGRSIRPAWISEMMEGLQDYIAEE
ncbi:hypothetical protein B484DRAFT_397617 [Ochromonadaceae sp. CCMP2298]|nr:hypothetical protein B484DRAFT_397617 [Ochromonadaceae sp. CCMP2298]